MSSTKMTIEQVRAWVQAAIADGWKAAPTYPAGPGRKGGEPVEQAATLRRDGWVAMAFARPQGWGLGWNEQAEITVWAPDELQVQVPLVYDWPALEDNATRCQYCGKSGKTVRISFAGRCCPPCRVEHVARVEPPGWCD